ncbi:MAG: glycerol acyltransferase, partial [Lentisphaeria bacterium]|nr:glycerol acyltransferase [Lentisphaeria bacterium]
MPNVLIYALIALAIILLLQPFFLLRILKFVCRITFFRIRVDGVGEIPASGPALLVANHVAFFDSLM